MFKQRPKFLGIWDVGGTLVYKKMDEVLLKKSTLLSFPAIKESDKGQNAFLCKQYYKFRLGWWNARRYILPPTSCTTQRAKFALSWTVWLVSCSEQASLLLLSHNFSIKHRLWDQKPQTQSLEKLPKLAVVTCWHMVVSGLTVFPLHAWPPKHTVSYPGIRMQTGKGAHKPCTLISTYSSICRLRNLKRGRQNMKKSISLVCDSKISQ